MRTTLDAIDRRETEMRNSNESFRSPENKSRGDVQPTSGNDPMIHQRRSRSSTYTHSLTGVLSFDSNSKRRIKHVRTTGWKVEAIVSCVRSADCIPFHRCSSRKNPKKETQELDDDEKAFKEKQREDQRKLDGTSRFRSSSTSPAALYSRCQEESRWQRSSQVGQISKLQRTHFQLLPFVMNIFFIE